MKKKELDNKVKVYKDKLSLLVNDRYPDLAQEDAIRILCNLLTDLGYKDIVDIYENIPKR